MRRRSAAERHGLTMHDSSLVGIEWNALTYAGHTVWNVHAERLSKGGGYKGGSRRRPRSEWVIQESTHEALITQAEADVILARLESYSVTRTRAGATDYLLTGLLKTPSGEPWHVDQGGRYYRTKGRTVSRVAVDETVLGQVAKDLKSRDFVGAMLERTRQADRSLHATEIAKVRTEMDAIGARQSKFLDMASQLAAPGPVLRKIDECERDREALAAHLATLESYQRAAEQLASVSEADVMQALDGVVDQMEHLPAADLRALLAGVIERIELDPFALSTRIHYRIAVDHRDKVASPREREVVPTIRGVGAGTIAGQ